MKVLFYWKDNHEESKKFQKFVNSLSFNGSIEIFHTVESIAGCFHRFAYRNSIGVFLIADQNDLEEVFSIRHLLHTTPLILLLHDTYDATVSTGHRLFPRFMSDISSNFSEVRAVLDKMIKLSYKIDKTDDFAQIDFQEYIDKISNNLNSLYSTDSVNIKVTVDAEKVFLNMKTAIPCGLIINELVTNSLKHAFIGNAHGEITISMRELSDNKIELIASVNGIGLPEHFDWKNSDSLGLKIVSLLDEGQLEGEIELLDTDGTTF